MRYDTWHLASEAVLLPIVAFGLLYLFWKGRREGLSSHAGLRYVTTGIVAFFLAVLVDFTDHFPALDSAVVLGKTDTSLYIKRIGYIVGCILVLVGVMRWLPLMTVLRNSERGLQRSNEQLRGEMAERVRAEQALREAEERLRAVISNTPAIVFAVDKEGVFTLAEGKGQQPLGGTPRQAVGLSIFDVYQDVPEVTENIRRALDGEPRSVVVEMSGRTFDALYEPVRDQEGQVTGVVGVVQDVTERRREEQRVQETSRLVAIGELAAGVAHEINNPLTVISGSAELLLSRHLQGPVEAGVRRIHAQAERASRIVHALLSFSRRRRPERSYVDLVEVLERTLELKAYDFRVNNIQVARDWPQDLPGTMAEEHQLTQLIINLLTNAEQAMIEAHKGGQLLIRAGVAGDRIRLSFTDDGPGIPREDLHRVFDPFFTTKEMGLGTGLGLSTCYGIAQAHGGDIWVESVSGVGTTFYVELPILGPSEAFQALSPPQFQAPDPGRRILVVDDEAEIRNILQEALSLEGYSVAVAGDGQEAWDKIGELSYDRVILDLKMPGMTGQQLYQLISRSNPDLAGKVIFITGDVLSTDTRSFIEATGNPSLRKPFSINDIRRLVLESPGLHGGSA